MWKIQCNSWHEQLLGMSPSPRASSLSGKVQGSQEMRLNSILVLKARARGDVFFHSSFGPGTTEPNDSYFKMQWIQARTHCALSFVFLMPCVRSCLLLASVCACLCARLCHFITTRPVWPQDCSQSTPLFSSIQRSLKHGETCCVVQWWVVNKM